MIVHRIFRSLATSLVLSVVFCQTSRATNISDIACPTQSWDLTKIHDRIYRSAKDLNDKTVMRCEHRGKHDGVNGVEDVPELSADAIKGAFDEAPCIEVDLLTTGFFVGSPDNRFYVPVLLHDQMSFRSTWHVRLVSNDIQDPGSGPILTNGRLATQLVDGPTGLSFWYGILSPGDQVVNVPFSQVWTGWLRSNAPKSTPSAAYEWVDLNRLYDYVQRCGDKIGIIELDVRDYATWQSTLNFFQGKSGNASTNEHFVFKSKIWKLVSQEYTYEELAHDIQLLDSYHVHAIYVITQAVANTNSDYLKQDSNGVTAAMTIGTALNNNALAGVEVSMPQGSRDPILYNTLIYLPDPCNSGALPGGPIQNTYHGWAGYVAAYRSCSTAYAPAIGGWIPYPEIQDGVYTPVTSPWPNDDPAWGQRL